MLPVYAPAAASTSSSPSDHELLSMDIGTTTTTLYYQFIFKSPLDASLPSFSINSPPLLPCLAQRGVVGHFSLKPGDGGAWWGPSNSLRATSIIPTR